MSKIEEGGLVLNHEPFDLIRYEKETQMLIDMQAQKNGIDFTVHIRTSLCIRKPSASPSCHDEYLQ